MRSFVPTVGRVESLDPGRIPQLHVFDYGEKHFAFDPQSLSLLELEPHEEQFLLGCKEPGTLNSLFSSDGQKDPLVRNLIQGLMRKWLLPPPNLQHDDQMPGSSVEIMVNATQECNLACQYCFVDQGRFSYGEKRVSRLSPQLAKRLVDILPEALPHAKEFCIHFYGGEPLLNLPAIRAAVEAAAESSHNFAFSVTTNGTVCSEEAFSVLRRGKFSIILSIDGPARIHDALRKTQAGEPTHEKVIDFLRQVKSDPALSVRGSSVVRRGWTLGDAHAYLKTLPVDLIKAQAVRVPESHPLALTCVERSAYRNDLAEIAGEVIGALKRGEAPRDDRFNPRVLQLLAGMRRTSFCGAGRSIFGVACDGTVYPCVLLAGNEEMILGSIDDPEMDWVERGRAWADRPAKDGCVKCWAQPLCGGGCPAMLSVCGEDECEFTRASCELALAIFGSIDDKIDLLTLAGVRG